MKSIRLVFIISAISLSCGQTGNIEKINPVMIKGTWYLNVWTLYHTLTFSNNTVFVDNNIDSVFELNYLISNDTLIIWDNPSQKFKNKIISLNDSSLVIDGIASIKENRIYRRKINDFMD
jgi:hypothetical protein